MYHIYIAYQVGAQSLIFPRNFCFTFLEKKMSANLMEKIFIHNMRMVARETTSPELLFNIMLNIY